MKIKSTYKSPETAKRLELQVSISNTTAKPWKTLSQTEKEDIESFLANCDVYYASWKDRVVKKIESFTATTRTKR